ncbi:MAG TPA: class I SAM-dependent methyltransferase [Spirochaetota bacterium]|nr:class I SAM-dependent methyltransferase [Spirochaetota bacterium]
MDTNVGWTYDEMKQVGTDYDSLERVREYDERMCALRDVSAEANAILDDLDLKNSDVLVEFGAGTGEFAIEASRRCRRVYALDVSRTMLDYARGKAERRGAGDISFVHSGFLGYTHDDTPPAAVVSQLALHHLPDFWKLVALSRVHDLLAPGGRFFMCDVVFAVQPGKAAASIGRTVERMRESAGEEAALDYERHVREEYSTYDWIMEEMLYRAGFHIERADYGDFFIATYLCLKPAARAR